MMDSRWWVIAKMFNFLKEMLLQLQRKYQSKMLDDLPNGGFKMMDDFKTISWNGQYIWMQYCCKCNNTFNAKMKVDFQRGWFKMASDFQNSGFKIMGHWYIPTIPRWCKIFQIVVLRWWMIFIMVNKINKMVKKTTLLKYYDNTTIEMAISLPRWWMFFNAFW